MLIESFTALDPKETLGELSAGGTDSGMSGGNSNWRGPIWMPVNALIIRALLHYYPITATTSKSSARPARES